MTLPLLSLELSARYPGKAEALKDVRIEVDQGEVLGLVGQSGCGKSTLALAILRLLHLKRGRMEGAIRFNGRDLMQLKESAMRRIRGREMALVLQSPLAALNPTMRIESQFREAWRAHRTWNAKEWERVLGETLEEVSLPAERSFVQRYPSELSVGQAQRVLIGMAILHRPLLLIADEPTSALDIVTQAEILELFERLNRKLGMSILYISHDLLSVAAISQRVAVMEQGRIVECGETRQLFRSPKHALTQRMIAALPVRTGFATDAAPLQPVA